MAKREAGISIISKTSGIFKERNRRGANRGSACASQDAAELRMHRATSDKSARVSVLFAIRPDKIKCSAKVCRPFGSDSTELAEVLAPPKLAADTLFWLLAPSSCPPAGGTLPLRPQAASRAAAVPMGIVAER